MSFKENLLKKIHIDNLSWQVLRSIKKKTGGITKIDKESMRFLLETAGYSCRKARDLELYCKKEDSETPVIIVLDNELPIYHTMVDDVVLRKSPTTKEMLNIRNIIKILNDSDVVKSRREKSLAVIQQECTGTLDLACRESDITGIETDGVSSLEAGNTDGVIEALSLFAELLEYQSPPGFLHFDGYTVCGRLFRQEDGTGIYGPMILYNKISNILLLIDKRAGKYDKETIEYVHQIAEGREKPAKEGYPVFQYLKELAVKSSKYSL